jgi:hypothetical protein
MTHMGWIKLHREIRDHWIWKDPVKYQWWTDILLPVKGLLIIGSVNGKNIKFLAIFITCLTFFSIL